MPDFPDKRSLPYRTTPHNDAVDFIDVGIAAHVTFNFPCQNQSVAKKAPQMTVTLKHLVAALSHSHDVPKKQTEAVLGDFYDADHEASEEGRHKSG